jgi:hypothetical protein
MHQRNKAEWMIRHFKNHFLSILAGVDTAFLLYLWDLLLLQAKLTANLLGQTTINPKSSLGNTSMVPLLQQDYFCPSGLEGSNPRQSCHMQVMGLQSQTGFLHGPCIGPLQVL